MTNYKELIERLYKSHKDYGEGRTQNFFRVSLDCKEAADAIETLTAELTEERQNHDRLQDWDRGMTEKLEQAQKRIVELEGQ